MISYLSFVIFTAVECVSQHFIFADVLMILFFENNVSDINYTTIYNIIKAYYNKIKYSINWLLFFIQFDKYV